MVGYGWKYRYILMLYCMSYAFMDQTFGIILHLELWIRDWLEE